MTYYQISAIVNCLSSLSIGVIVYLKNTKNSLNVSFSLFCLCIGTWSLGYAFWQFSNNESSALFWCKILMAGASFISPALFHFVITLLDLETKNFYKKALKIGYVFAFLFLALDFTPFFIKGISANKFFKFWPQPGPIYPLYLLVFFGYSIFSWCLMLKRYLSVKGSKKNQMKYILFGTIIGYFGGSTNYPLWYNIPIPPYGNCLVTIYVISIGYAIAKHHLLDINIVFKKTIIYSVFASVIAITFSLSVILFEHIFKQTMGYKSFAPTLLVALFIAIFFQPLYKWLSSFVDKLFFKGTLPQIAEELQRSEKLAALGVLASGLAHEIKNPLAPIKLYIQNLPKNKNNSDYLDKIAKVVPEEVDKITDIINQLQTFANPPKISTSSINLHNLIDGRLKLLEQDLISRHIEVERHYSPALSSINADPIQLERVFLNLFLNAIDAMPNGGTLTISTELNSDNSAVIKVKDTGIGIAPEDLPHIFDPFYTKGKHKGTGLGLAITHQIIKEHRGTIKVESKCGESSSFCIYLPVQ